MMTNVLTVMMNVLTVLKQEAFDSFRIHPSGIRRVLPVGMSDSQGGGRGDRADRFIRLPGAGLSSPERINCRHALVA